MPLFKYFISFLIERVHKICYEKKEARENQKYHKQYEIHQTANKPSSSTILPHQHTVLQLEVDWETKLQFHQQSNPVI